MIDKKQSMWGFVVPAWVAFVVVFPAFMVLFVLAVVFYRAMDLGREMARVMRKDTNEYGWYDAFFLAIVCSVPWVVGVTVWSAVK